MCLRPVHDISGLPVQVASMQGIAEKYRVTTEENRRLYNEVQDLKGNIRVFCRVRPPGATGDGSACKETSCLMGALRFSGDCALALLSVRALVMLRTHGCGCLGTGMHLLIQHKDKQGVIRTHVEGHVMCLQTQE